MAPLTPSHSLHLQSPNTVVSAVDAAVSDFHAVVQLALAAGVSSAERIDALTNSIASGAMSAVDATAALEALLNIQVLSRFEAEQPRSPCAGLASQDGTSDESDELAVVFDT
eukprot:1156833-Prymnesium_polylepis.1